MRTREIERDYARYGAARRSPARLPRTGAEAMDFALRALRERLGHVLSASLVPAILFVLAFSYTVTFALPSLGQTSDPSSMLKQVGEFALAIVVALLVAIPLIVLALAGLSVTAMETAREWTRTPKRPLPSGIAPYGLAARILGWCLLLSLRIFLIGFALMLIGGVFLATLGEDSPVPSIFGVIGVLVALFGLLAAVYTFSRASIAVPAGLYEGLRPKEAFARAKALAVGRQSLTVGTTATESAIVVGGIIALVLILGLNLLAATINLGDAVVNLFTSPLVRAMVGEALRVFPAFLAAMVLLPYISIVNVMSYFERRVAVDGLDIELMAARLAEGRR